MAINLGVNPTLETIQLHFPHLIKYEIHMDLKKCGRWYILPRTEMHLISLVEMNGVSENEPYHEFVLRPKSSSPGYVKYKCVVFGKFRHMR